MEVSIPYAITGPDGTRIVVGNSDAAKADPDWVGWLDPDNGISIQPDVRQSSEDASDVEGAYHGLFQRGRAAIAIQGALDPGLGISVTEGKLKRAVRALATDGILRFTPTGYAERAYWFRLAQAPAFSGRRPKQFQLQLISARPYALAPVEKSFSLRYSDHVLADAPALYWHLGEAAGTSAADSSGNGRTGTYTGGFTLAQAGALVGTVDAADKAVLLNGSTGWLNSTYAPFTGGSTRTVEGWAYRNSSGSHDTLFGGDGTTGPILRLRSGGNTVEFFASSGASSVQWANAWPGNGQWVHWVLVYDDTARQASLYINGALVSTQTLAGGSGYGATPGNFRAGAWWSGTDPFDGLLDELATYHTTPLAAARILDHYNAGKACVTNAGELATWPRFRIQGPITNPSIQNTLSAQTIRFICALVAGQYIDVYADPLAPAAVIDQSRTDRYSYYDRVSSRWWQLQPGANALLIGGTGITAATAITAYSRDAWD
jgi:hypothetical protein